MPYCRARTPAASRATPTPELYARWIEEARVRPGDARPRHPQLAPLALGLRRRTPKKAITKAIELRYRLIPYFYTFAAPDRARTGAPADAPPGSWSSPRTRRHSIKKDEWLMGDRLLAAPRSQSKAAHETSTCPQGRWYDFNTNASNRRRPDAARPGTTRHDPEPTSGPARSCRSARSSNPRVFGDRRTRWKCGSTPARNADLHALRRRRQHLRLPPRSLDPNPPDLDRRYANPNHRHPRRLVPRDAGNPASGSRAAGWGEENRRIHGNGTANKALKAY